MQHLLTQPTPFDAVFAAYAIPMVGAQEMRREQSLRVPQDMALACFSNDPFTAMTQLHLAVIDQRPEQRAKPPYGSFCSCSSAGQYKPRPT